MRICICITLLSLFSCSGEQNGDISSRIPSTNPESSGIPNADVWLTVIDTIGAEFGDTNYIFVDPLQVQFMPNGNIAVLDLQKCMVSVFSSCGDHLTSIGRYGSGPGEFQAPSALAITDEGGVIVSDLMSNRISYFDETYKYSNSINGFVPFAPTAISISINGSIVGVIMEYEQRDDNTYIGNSIVMWGITGEKLITYASSMVRFDPSDISGMSGANLFHAVDRYGKVFVSQHSTDKYLITAYSAEGTVVYTIEEEYIAVKKNDYELEQEMENLRSNLASKGIPTSMLESFSPEKYKQAITGLYVDSENRLWVQSGSYNTPIFRVYDCETGDFLFTGGIYSTSIQNELIVCINKYGYAAVLSNSSDYPKVLLLSL